MITKRDDIQSLHEKAMLWIRTGGGHAALELSVELVTSSLRLVELMSQLLHLHRTLPLQLRLLTLRRPHLHQRHAA